MHVVCIVRSFSGDFLIYTSGLKDDVIFHITSHVALILLSGSETIAYGDGRNYFIDSSHKDEDQLHIVVCAPGAQSATTIALLKSCASCDCVARSYADDNSTLRG